MSDRAKLQALHAAATRACEVLAPFVETNGEAKQALAELEAALEANNPKRAREATPLGARILEAALEVGLDETRIVAALALPSGVLTRLLYHDVKKPKLEHLELVAKVLGCDGVWLRTGEGERRQKPVPLGVVSARSLGASEEAIQLVLERDRGMDRDEASWLTTFLEETKRLRESAGSTALRESADASTTRLRDDD